VVLIWPQELIYFAKVSSILFLNCQNLRYYVAKNVNEKAEMLSNKVDVIENE